MQPLIQHFFSQIIDSCLYFPEVPLGNKAKSGQKFTRNATNGFECLKLIWSWSGTFNTQTFWL